MQVFVGSDHGGYRLKTEVVQWLEAEGHEVTDMGTDGTDSVDYPGFGLAVGQKVAATPGALGVVVCGSGVGISIAANKVAGVRCVLANSVELATLGREHNGANVLAMGERTAWIDNWKLVLAAFFASMPDMGERHVRRRTQLDVLGGDMEADACGCD